MNRTSLLWRLLWSVAIVFAVSLPLHAGVRSFVDSNITNIRPENIAFLRYLRYENRFDSAGVSLTIGEFCMIVNGQEERQYFSHFPDEFKLHKGSNQTGIDTVLQALGRTEPFELKAGTITFHRQLEAYTALPCGMYDPATDPTSGGGCPKPPTWQDGYYYVGAGRIPDITEFVIQIVRDSDDVVLGTLDSVGVLPNPTSCIATRYGTNPDMYHQVRTIPSALVGTRVYLQISPRRYGPTPYGIVMNKVKSYFSYSTTFEMSPTGIERLTKEELDTIDARYYREARDYLDYIMLTTGMPPFPPEEPLTGLKKGMLDSLTLRYYIPHILRTNGHLVYAGKDSLTFANEYWGHPFARERAAFEDMKPSVNVLSVTPNPVTNGRATIRLALARNKKVPTSGKVELYDLAGNRITEVWAGTFPTTPFDVELYAFTVPNNAYVIFVKSNLGVQLGMTKILIQKK